MADKFEDLRTYVTIIETGGVNAAASSLGIAKSAVSRRLGELEDRLGVTLIERTTRRFETTLAGRLYFDRAKTLLKELDILDATFAAGDERIVISAEPSLLDPVVHSVATFQLRHPDWCVEIVGEDMRAAHLIVTSGKDGQQVGTFSRVLVASPDYLEKMGVPRSVDDLAGHRGIGNAGEVWHPGVSTAAAPQIHLTVPDARAALKAVVAGSGIASLPDFMVVEALDRGLLEALPHLGGDAATVVRTRMAKAAPASAILLADHVASTLFDKRP